MNISGIYSDAIRSSSENEEAKELALKKQIELEQFDAATRMAHHEWFNHPVTKKFFLNLKKLSDDLIERATQQAVNYPQHQNPDAIIKLLIQAATVNDTIKTYARSTDN